MIWLATSLAEKDVMTQPVEKAKKLRKMLVEVPCARNHRCADTGFRDLCRAEDVDGSGKVLTCLEPLGASCGYQVEVGHGQDRGTLCNCPVRIYLQVELGL